jgi:hypothetical protein
MQQNGFRCLAWADDSWSWRWRALFEQQVRDRRRVDGQPAGCVLVWRSGRNGGGNVTVTVTVGSAWAIPPTRGTHIGGATGNAATARFIGDFIIIVLR